MGKQAYNRTAEQMEQLVRARRIDPDPAWSAGLPGAQYTVAFELDGVASRTPEQWARAVFEQGPPRWWRRLLDLGWRYLLGLRLTRSPRAVAGWPIVAEAETSITLAASSRWLSAQDVFVLRASSVVWITVVRYDKPLGRLLWGLAAPMHHLTIPWLFTRADALSR